MILVQGLPRAPADKADKLSQFLRIKILNAVRREAG